MKGGPRKTGDLSAIDHVHIVTIRGDSRMRQPTDLWHALHLSNTPNRRRVGDAVLVKA